MDKQALLKELARMSQAAGARIDYVQGGGGNTSVKLPGGLMAIKASGFRLAQVTEENAFAVVETETLKDVTVEQGYDDRRPSVEVGFHSLLKTFVLHTHPVYANLILCSETGLARLPELMKGISYIVVPYINPGAELSTVIKEKKTEETQAVFMVNHGLVVTADTADECLRLHDEINNRIALSYGVTPADFNDLRTELAKTLYPDQQVYLTLTEVQQEIVTAITFIHITLAKNGEKAQAMDGSAMNYIKNWEGEAYRKSILK